MISIQIILQHKCLSLFCYCYSICFIYQWQIDESNYPTLLHRLRVMITSRKRFNRSITVVKQSIHKLLKSSRTRRLPHVIYSYCTNVIQPCLCKLTQLCTGHVCLAHSVVLILLRMLAPKYVGSFFFLFWHSFGNMNSHWRD